MYLNILTFLDWFNKPFLDSTLTNFQFVVIHLKEPPEVDVCRGERVKVLKYENVIYQDKGVINSV